MKGTADTRRKPRVLHPPDLLSPFSEKRDKAPSGPRKYVPLFFIRLWAPRETKSNAKYSRESRKQTEDAGTPGRAASRRRGGSPCPLPPYEVTELPGTCLGLRRGPLCFHPSCSSSQRPPGPLASPLPHARLPLPGASPGPSLDSLT